MFGDNYWCHVRYMFYDDHRSGKESNIAQYICPRCGADICTYHYRDNLCVDCLEQTRLEKMLFTMRGANGSTIIDLEKAGIKTEHYDPEWDRILRTNFPRRYGL